MLFHINLEWDIEDEALLQMEKTHVAVTSPGPQRLSRLHKTQTDRPPKGCALDPASPKRCLDLSIHVPSSISIIS